MLRAHVISTALLVSLAMPVVAMAGTPSVEFDTDPTVAVVDITTPEFAAINPGERLIEVHVQISSLIRHGEDDDLIQFLYSFESPEMTARVVDYLPQTTLSTDVVGSVGIEQSDERSRQLGLNAGTNQPGIGTASATASGGTRENQRVQYALLPPLELLAASGTINRGSGVYFKLKPSRRTSLEGASDFMLVLRVPRDWRADVLRVHCEALGTEHRAPWEGDRQRVFGSSEFSVALYQQGDEVSRAAAEQFVLHERWLLETAYEYRNTIAETAHPHVWDRWAAELDIREPRIPDGWLSDILHMSPVADHERYHDRLPEPVDAAIDRYSESKRVMYSLSGAYARVVPARIQGETPVTVAEGS